MDFLNKKFQQELKERYAVAMKAVWGNSQKMIDYCVKQAAVFIPVANNGIAVIDKPHIETDFYFGYSDCGQGLSYEENNERVNHVTDNLAEYFVNYNLRDINEKIKLIEEILDSGNKDGEYIIINSGHYSSDTVNSAHSMQIVRPYNFYTGNATLEEVQRHDATAAIASLEDVKRYLEAYKFVKEMFTKRLNTYLKRFGTSKLSVGTYWVDR